MNKLIRSHVITLESQNNDYSLTFIYYLFGCFTVIFEFSISHKYQKMSRELYVCPSSNPNSFRFSVEQLWMCFFGTVEDFMDDFMGFCVKRAQG